jgi:phosphoglycolate phosphatase-like HAD superfamily hydrolase
MTEKILVFDMDGLILNSLDALSNCMQNAIKSFCKNQKQFEDFKEYDFDNPGLSRFEKIDFFIQTFSRVDKIDIDKMKSQVINKFDNLSLQARLNSNIDDSIYKIGEYFAYQNLVLLSNCENSQLLLISKNFKLSDIFKRGIYGTPPNKLQRFSDLVSQGHDNNFISISDSEADAIIARKLGFDFIFIRKFARDDGAWLKPGEMKYQSLTQLFNDLKP